MNCSECTDCPDDFVLRKDEFIYPLISVAGALLLIVIVQCIALMVCGCSLKRKRQRTQEKGNLQFATNKNINFVHLTAIEASNGHELKPR